MLMKWVMAVLHLDFPLPNLSISPTACLSRAWILSWIPSWQKIADLQISLVGVAISTCLDGCASPQSPHHGLSSLCFLLLQLVWLRWLGDWCGLSPPSPAAQQRPPVVLPAGTVLFIPAKHCVCGQTARPWALLLFLVSGYEGSHTPTPSGHSLLIQRFSLFQLISGTFF